MDQKTIDLLLVFIERQVSHNEDAARTFREVLEIIQSLRKRIEILEDKINDQIN